MNSYNVKIELSITCTPEEARIITDAAVNAAFTRCHDMHGSITAHSYIAEKPHVFDPYADMSECDKAHARRAQVRQQQEDGV